MTDAKFDSRCPACDEPIHEGDRIGVVDGEWLCEECVEDAGGEDGRDG
jgi:formylmethanofuran dehydrogenase subunit E